jgi:hypothetical protein
MRKVPYVFEDRKELLKFLKSETTKSHVEDYFSKRLPDVSAVVLQSIAGNTFRAFRVYRDRRPSTVFREWASTHLDKTLKGLKNITDHEGYTNYVHESAIDLCATWSAKMNADIGYGRSTKLFNLVLKRLPCLESLDEAFRRKIIKFQHVPLDSYTIVGLRKLITNPKIPRNATMKFIENPTDYKIMQRYISDVAKEAGVPAIYYDVLAWNMAH